MLIVEPIRCKKHEIPLTENTVDCRQCGGDGFVFDKDECGAPETIRCWVCCGSGEVEDRWCEFCEMEEH